jgi:hypothetical protein
MHHQRTALPPRTDLRAWRTRAAARVMVRSLGLVEGLVSRLVVDVAPPAGDPFHRVPEDLETFRPGEVLDARPVEVRGFLRKVDADAWQVRFRSTDSHGAAVSGITTVMIPRQPFDGPVRPLLSYQAAIDSLGAAADPSFTLRRGDQKELVFMARALHRGWAVVTTDYTGPRHAFGVGLVAAHFVLDGIRAALAFEPAGFDAATPIGLWGYSGGAQATLFAAEQQSAYAPELHVVGAAAGGVPVDPTSSTRIFRDGSIFSGLALGACIGVSRERPDVDLLGVLTPRGQAMVAAAAEMTIEQLGMTFPFLVWGDYLTVPNVYEIPGMRAAFESIRLGQATPMTTSYLYHAIHDQNLAVADVDQLVAKYRREGAHVTYRRVRFGEHVIVMGTGARSALRFLGDRFGSPSRTA